MAFPFRGTPHPIGIRLLRLTRAYRPVPLFIGFKDSTTCFLSTPVVYDRRDSHPLSRISSVSELATALQLARSPMRETVYSEAAPRLELFKHLDTAA